MSTLTVVLVVLIGAGLLEPLLLGRPRRGRTDSELALQLPDGLDLLARAIRAGHPISAALGVAVQQLRAPLADEFDRVQRDIAQGLATDAALHALASRHSRQLELRMLAVAVAIQQETGGPLLEVLGNLSRTLRERISFANRIRAATAGGRLAIKMAAVVPLGFAATVYFLYPQYLSGLGDDAGLVIGAAAVLWLLGVAWTMALSRVKY